MANSYTKLYYHIICVVKRRANLISSQWKDELYKYITGIVNNKKQKVLIINGMPDHIHILLRMNADIHVSELARDIKASSSKFINERKFTKDRFEWQTGFAAFTIGHSQFDMVLNYIKNQEKHHSDKTLREEYIYFLNENDIDWNPEYLFD